MGVKAEMLREVPMFLMMINCGGNGTGVSLVGTASEPATAVARVRRAVALGDLPTRRSGAEQLM
ncbi:MAG TPA: hypothetical protein VFM01_08435 [Nakamurella sp.]|jgi:hypothetical protein|nr:hypothetical protein [Nakamurella sp.]